MPSKTRLRSDSNGSSGRSPHHIHSSHDIRTQTPSKEEQNMGKPMLILGISSVILFFAITIPIIFAVVKGLWGYLLFYCGAKIASWLGLQYYASVEEIAYVGGMIYAGLGFVNGLFYTVPKLSFQLSKNIVKQMNENKAKSKPVLAQSSHQSLARSSAKRVNYSSDIN